MYSIVTTPDPASVTTGAVRSGAFTFTVRVTVLPGFPAASVWVYSRIYVPGVNTSTDPEEADPVNPVPSTLSVQSAPSSVYDPLWVTFITEAPERVTTGAVVSVSITLIVRSIDPVLPERSTCK